MKFRHALLALSVCSLLAAACGGGGGGGTLDPAPVPAGGADAHLTGKLLVASPPPAASPERAFAPAAFVPPAGMTLAFGGLPLPLDPDGSFRFRDRRLDAGAQELIVLRDGETVLRIVVDLRDRRRIFLDLFVDLRADVVEALETRLDEETAGFAARSRALRLDRAGAVAVERIRTETIPRATLAAQILARLATLSSGAVGDFQAAATPVALTAPPPWPATADFAFADPVVALELASGDGTLRLGPGQSAAPVVVGHLAPGGTVDLTGRAELLTSDSAVAAIDGARVLAVAPGDAVVRARAFGLESPPLPVAVRSAAAQSVALSLAASSGLVLDPVVCSVTATRLDGAVVPVTDQAEFLFDPPDAARFENGTIIPLKGGLLQVTARYGGATSPPASFQAQNAIRRIRLLLSAAEVAVGGTLDFQILADWRDGTSTDVTDAAELAIADSRVIREGRSLRGVSPGVAGLTPAYGGLTGETVPLTVRSAVLVGLELSFDRAEIYPGEASNAAVTAVYSDGARESATTTAQFTATPAGIVAFAGAAATGVAPGVAQVVATLGGISSPAFALRVRENPVVAVTLEILEPGLPAGLQCSVLVTARRADGSTYDATAGAVFETDPAHAVVAGGILTAVAPGFTSVVARVGDVASPGVALTVLAPVTLSLSLALTASSVPAGSAELLALAPAYAGVASGDILPRFTVTSHLSDGSTADVSASALLAFPEALLARDGTKLRGLAAGVAQISASHAGFTSEPLPFTVTAPLLYALAVEPQASTVPAGLSTVFVARGSNTDGSTTDLTASCDYRFDADLVAVTPGAIRGIVPGDAPIVAAFAGIESPPFPFRVTGKVLTALAWLFPLESLPAGNAAAYQLTGTWSDGSASDLTADEAVTYEFNPAVVQVGGGQIYAAAAGGTRIVARRSGVESPALDFTVTAGVPQSLAVSLPQGAEVALGLAIPVLVHVTGSDGLVTEIGAAATFSFGAPGVVEAEVGANGMQLRGRALGVTSVTASFAGIDSPPVQVTVLAKRLVSLAVAASPAQIILGETASLSAAGTYSDGSIEDVTAQAEFLALPETEAGLSGTTLAPTVSRDYTLTASVGAVVSPPVVFRVGPKAVRELFLTLDRVAAPLGRNINATVRARFSDGTNEPVVAAFEFSVPGVFSASGGTLTAAQTGSTDLRAAFGGVRSAWQSITAEPAVLETLTAVPAALELAKGMETTVAVTGGYSDGTTVDHTAVATVDASVAGVVSWNAGVVKGLAVGATVLTIAHLGVERELPVTVGPPELLSLDFAPDAATALQGMAIGFTLMAAYSDGDSVDIAASAVWTVAPAGAARVDGADGRIVVLKPGAFTVSAAFGGKVTAPAAFTGTPLLLERIVANRSSSSFDLLLLFAAPTSFAVRYGTDAEPGLSTAPAASAGMSLVTLAPFASDSEVRHDLRLTPDAETVAADNSGALFSARTARVGIGLNYILSGRLLFGGQPVAGAYALVAKSGADPLAARSDADGYWFVNLANLKSSSTGLPMPFAAGDAFTVREIYGPTNSATRAYQLSGASPDQIP